jgi:hypothetical protein
MSWLLTTVLCLAVVVAASQAAVWWARGQETAIAVSRSLGAFFGVASFLLAVLWFPDSTVRQEVFWVGFFIAGMWGMGDTLGRLPARRSGKPSPLWEEK